MQNLPKIALHQKLGLDTRSGGFALNKIPPLVVACNFGARPPKIETVEQAREVLLGMDEQQEITAASDEGPINIKKHGDHEFSAEFVDHETGIISLRDASHILLEHGDKEFYFA